MIDKAYLNYVIARAGLTKKEFAELINMSDRTLRDKISGRTEFNVTEMNAVRQALKLPIDELEKIFVCQ